MFAAMRSGEGFSTACPVLGYSPMPLLITGA
jgi:hypothetical protein